MITYIDDLTHRYEVEAICRVLPIAPPPITPPAADRPQPGPCATPSSRSRLKIARLHAEQFGV
jgi:hypothetical protein